LYDISNPNYINAKNITVVGDISATGKIYGDDYKTKVSADVTNSMILSLSNSNQIIGVDRSTPITITIPEDNTVDFDIGTNIVIYQKGSGQVSLSAYGAVQILSNSGKVKTTGQYSSVALFKLASNSWLLGGDLTT
jgi:hypothetical protein